MNRSASDPPPPGAKPEGAVVRFLRWLIETPEQSLSGKWRVVRWLLRAVAFVLALFVAGEVGMGDTFAEGGGGGGVRYNDKPPKPPA